MGWWASTKDGGISYAAKRAGETLWGDTPADSLDKLKRTLCRAHPGLTKTVWTTAISTGFAPASIRESVALTRTIVIQAFRREFDRAPTQEELLRGARFSWEPCKAGLAGGFAGFGAPRRTAARAARALTLADAAATHARLQNDASFLRELVPALRPFVPTRWGVRPDGRGAGPYAAPDMMEVVVPLSEPGWRAPAGMSVLPGEQWRVEQTRAHLLGAGYIIRDDELDPFVRYRWIFRVTGVR